MIAYIKGEVKLINEEGLTVNVNGVGYLVHASNLVQIGSEVELYIHTIVKENEISLWGFESSRELKVFEKLLSVSGVGGRTAQLIIQTHGVESIVKFIQFREADSLRVKGVGKKTAEKIILELENKLDDLGIDVSTDGVEGQAGQMSLGNAEVQNAVEALVSLGYQKRDIDVALADFKKDEGDKISEYNSQDIIKKMLKYI